MQGGAAVGHHPCLLLPSRGGLAVMPQIIPRGNISRYHTHTTLAAHKYVSAPPITYLPAPSRIAAAPRSSCCAPARRPTCAPGAPMHPRPPGHAAAAAQGAGGAQASSVHAYIDIWHQGGRAGGHMHAYMISEGASGGLGGHMHAYDFSGWHVHHTQGHCLEATKRTLRFLTTLPATWLRRTSSSMPTCLPQFHPGRIC